MVYLACSYPNGVGGARFIALSLRDDDNCMDLYFVVGGEGDGSNASGHSLVSAAKTSASQSVRLRILLSYHYYKDVDLDDLFTNIFGEPYPELFVDSGGFSAMTQGAHIDIKEYAAWIKRWKHWITTYANLDIIGNAAATRENQHRLEDLGLQPLPVFHIGERWDYLDASIEQYPYIALGGLVPVPYRTALPWLVRCFKKARPDQTQPPLAVYHGFGVSSWETLLHFPFYSVDSSSWTGGFRFGSFSIFNDRTGKWLKVSVGQRKQAYAIAPLLRSYGVDPADLADRSRYHSKKIAPAAVLSWVRAEQYLRRRHGPIHIPERPPTSGQEDILLPTTPHSVMHLTDAGVLHQQGAPSDPDGQKLYLSPGMDPDKGLVGVNKQLGEIGPGVHLALAGTTDDHRIQAADAALKGYLTTGHALGAAQYHAGQAGLKTCLANGREGRREHAVPSVTQETSPGLHAHRACGGYVHGDAERISASHHELHKGQ